MRTNVRLRFLFGVATASAIALQVFGGHPFWPPRKHSAEYRQANMLFLRLQDALAAERWEEALSFCSDRVRAKAAEWPSPEAFFKETLPIGLLLARDFGYYTLRSDKPEGGQWGTDKAVFYGLFVTLSEPESKPRVDWFWGISSTNHAWVVDYPPVKLEDYIARKKAALQEREDKMTAILRSLEPKAKGIKTRLLPVSERFVTGAPMLFRVELANLGQTTADYRDLGVAFKPLTVLDDGGQPLPYTLTPSQIVAGQGKVAPGTSVVIADRIDLNRHYAIIKPGKYVVQFGGAGLQIGQPLPHNLRRAPFGEDQNERALGLDFIALTNRFPSDPITIKVTAGPNQ